MPSMFAILIQRRQRWLRHSYRMNDVCISKYMLYNELTTGTRPIGRPVSRYRYVCELNLEVGSMGPEGLYTVTSYRDEWRFTVEISIH